MAGIGAALGGLASGYVQGVKLKSELADAEEKRGLMALQKQSAQIQIDNEKAMQTLGQQIGEEIKSFAAMPNRDDPELFDAHYSKLGGLLKQQAILARKDPLEVDKSIQAMRKERFAERVFQATQLLKDGDVEGGMAALQPVYNRIYKDGNTLTGFSHDVEKDLINLQFTRKDGTTGTRSVPRMDFATNIAPLVLNYADAVKLDHQAREAEKGRKFEGEQKGLDRTSREGIARMEQQGADRRSAASNATSVKVAEIGREGRSEARADSTEREYRDRMLKDIDNAMAFSNRSSGIPPTEGELRELNFTRSAATTAFDTTYKKTGVPITGAQFKNALDAYRANPKSVFVKDNPELGLRGIKYEGVEFLVPINSGLFAPKGIQGKQ